MARLNMLVLSGRRLEELYRVAYLGRSFAFETGDTLYYNTFLYKPVLEVADPSVFTDTKLGRNRYSYSQTLPVHRRAPDIMMRAMQADLKMCFGFEVAIETRKMPYLRLVTIDRTRIVQGTAGTTRWDEIAGGHLPNTTLSNLIALIDHATGMSYNYNLPLLDETDIDHRIDIRLDAILTSIHDITRALRKSGLDIVHGEKSFRVLVIRDPPG